MRIPTDTEYKILSFIDENGPSRPCDIASKYKISSESIYNIMYRMIKKKYIARGPHCYTITNYGKQSKVAYTSAKESIKSHE